MNKRFVKRHWKEQFEDQAAALAAPAEQHAMQEQPASSVAAQRRQLADLPSLCEGTPPEADEAVAAPTPERERM